MTAVEPRSSESLREEMAQIDGDILALDAKLLVQVAQIKLHSLSARRGNPEAAKAIAECESVKKSIEVEKSHAGYSKELLNDEIVEAEKREEFERAKLAAARQEEVAQELDVIADECDRG